MFGTNFRNGNRVAQCEMCRRCVCASSRSSLQSPHALTLIEMLIGMAITLVMMAAVVNLFANIGQSVRTRRAGMEMNGQLRMARSRLYKDLAGATCPAKPWREPGNDEGYLEIIEGKWSDKVPSLLVDGVDNGLASANPELDYASSLIPSGGDPNLLPPVVGTPNAVTNGYGLGDYDDILALTVRSESEPFVGRALVWDSIDRLWVERTIESNLAEVIWYAVENPADGSLGEPGMRTVYRRVLLIAPWVELPYLEDFGQATPDLNALAFTLAFDISARVSSSGQLIPNTLSDLTKRENRFAHRLSSSPPNLGWPFAVDQRPFRQLSYDPLSPPADVLGPFRPFGAPFEPALNHTVPIGPFPERDGEDVMLSDVLAFDLRVFDPGAPLFEYAGTIVEPVSDNVFATVVSRNTPVGYGTYVDLGWDDNYDYDYTVYAAPVPQPLFQEERLAGWHPRVPLPYRGTPAVYDTWSTHYESDGIDQDGLAGTDQGTNGFDDDGLHGTDDVGERETSPPYDVPLSGMQVKFRIYERDTRQIREATVTKNFSD